MNLFLIILGILKIVLFTVLIVLAVALIIICLVIFVPVRYNVAGDISSNGEGTAKMSWLFKVFQLKYKYSPQYTETIVKICGITVYKQMGPEKEATPEEGDANREETKVAVIELGDKPEEFYKNEEGTTGAKAETDIETARKEEKRAKKQKLKKEKKPKSSKTKTKLKIMDIINYPHRNEIISLTSNLIKKLIIAIKPDVFIVYGELGFENPADTGMFAGGLSVFTAMTGFCAKLKLNFEEQIMDLKILIKGRFLLWSILWPLFKYILQKPIWEIVSKLLFGKGDNNEC